MIELDAVKIIALVTIFISSILLFFLLIVKTKSKLSNLLLASLVVLCSIDIFSLFINDLRYFYLIFNIFSFLIFPTLFLYVLSICRTDFKLKLKYLLHVIPFIVYLLILLLYFLYNRNLNSNSIAEILNKMIWICNAIVIKLQALFYLIKTISVLRKHKKIYLKNYTDGNIALYKLLFQVLLLFIITFPIALAREIISYTVYSDILYWLNFVLIAIALIMFCFFILKALLNPILFRSVDFNIQTSNKISKNSNHKINNTLESDAVIEQLQQYMIKKEPYLNPSLTLLELSSKLNISSRNLTNIVNNHLGYHFFDFVNYYRIEKAKLYLQDYEKNKLTIQQIFYAVGFNSKSSFNSAFKKHTGITPTEFKNKFS